MCKVDVWKKKREDVTEIYSNLLRFHHKPRFAFHKVEIISTYFKISGLDLGKYAFYGREGTRLTYKKKIFSLVLLSNPDYLEILFMGETIFGLGRLYNIGPNKIKKSFL
jgi:hypothetical protein